MFKYFGLDCNLVSGHWVMEEEYMRHDSNPTNKLQLYLILDKIDHGKNNGLEQNLKEKTWLLEINA